MCTLLETIFISEFIYTIFSRSKAPCILNLDIIEDKLHNFNLLSASLSVEGHLQLAPICYQCWVINRPFLGKATRFVSPHFI
jgi:hypothetical protein